MRFAVKIISYFRNIFDELQKHLFQQYSDDYKKLPLAIFVYYRWCYKLQILDPRIYRELRQYYKKLSYVVYFIRALDNCMLSGKKLQNQNSFFLVNMKPESYQKVQLEFLFHFSGIVFTIVNLCWSSTRFTISWLVVLVQHKPRF